MKEYFSHISGIQFLAVSALLVFFILFVFILVKVIRLDKRKTDKFSRLPLEADKPD